MPDYKVTYFDMAASRGEEVRLALTIAGIPFEDDRLARGEFGPMKADFPFAALPTLEIKGHGVFAQSNAILRLIGRQSGLHPEDLFEAARHDAFMDAVEDFRHKISPTGRIEDAAERKAARQQLAAEYIPQWATCIERLIGVGPFVGGAKASVADIKLFMAHRWIANGVLDDIPSDLFDAYPKFNAVAAGVKNHPAVVAWYAATA